MLLTWDLNGSPQLSPVAMICYSDYFPNDLDVVLDDNLTLMGDFLTIEDPHGIAIWNWRQDTIGFMNGEGYEWRSQNGFSSLIFPPHIYVAPASLSNFQGWEIPDFHSTNTHTNRPQRLPPPSSDQRALPYLETGSTSLEFDLILLDEWIPAKSNPGIAILSTDEWEGSTMQKKQFQDVIILRGENYGSKPPRLIPAGAIALEPIRRRPYTLRLGDHELFGRYGATVQRVIDEIDPQATFGLDVYPFDGSAFQNTTSRKLSISAESEWDINIPDMSSWTCYEPPCLLSGTCHLYKSLDEAAVHSGDKPLIAVLHFAD
ncbi:hypothetical protein DL93DRAFT_781133 [Clavulina sp. PMI_390]|nr:hypothetical protein DL93DRAFT_781133 [Clavulina sp. PMI_390]